MLHTDGGRIWEGVWRAYLERLHVQKAQAKSNIPLQTRSGTSLYFVKAAILSELVMNGVNIALKTV